MDDDVPHFTYSNHVYGRHLQFFERKQMKKIKDKFDKWRKNTFPASKNDIEWRHEAIMGQMRSSFDKIEAMLSNNSEGERQDLSEYFVFKLGEHYFLLDRLSLVDKILFQDKCWEPEQIKFLFDEFRGSSDPTQNIFLDIGAYFGLYSIKAVESRKFGEIHAFEADPHTIGQLHANVFMNNLCDKIAIHNFAASSYKGEAPFNESRSMPHNRGMSGILRDKVIAKSHVPCNMIDNVLSFRDKYIVAKIDVEGHEKDVLSGMKQLLSYNRVMVQAEGYDETKDQLFDTMKDYGFRHKHTIFVDHYFKNYD